ncbi:hypothetical protein Hanom_Chr03g00257141 [Helianthus anomalus]
MKMGRFQTFWIQMLKNKPLDKRCKTDQTSETKMAYNLLIVKSKLLLTSRTISIVSSISFL